MSQTFSKAAVTSILLVTGALSANETSSKQTNICDNDKKSSDGCILEQDLERITVIGQKLNPISSQSTGSYNLDKKLIEDYRFGNGNLNDILAILPGVQFSDDTRAEDQLTSIVPNEVSISGAKGHQSGYNIDGISNNSRLSTGNAQVDQNLRQDINVHSQASFINLALIDSIEVFDSNIPAKYGQFSGGLVNVTTKEPAQTPSYGFSYRTTGDNMSKQIHIIGPQNEAASRLYVPKFDKYEADAFYSGPITSNSGITLHAQILDSTEYLDQLGQVRAKGQKNGNFLVKYFHELSNNDDLSFTAVYAPFEGNYFEQHQRNSDYSTSGGGLSSRVEYTRDNKWGLLTSQLSFSDNSYEKRAPNQWLAWDNIKGKTWGNYYGGETSIEGGYGDIDKIEQRATLDIDAELLPWQWLGMDLMLTLGANLQHQAQEFNRLNDSIIYNGIIRNSDIDCGSYRIDCVETNLKLSIEQLEQQLGRPLDLTNFDDIQLYENNVIDAGQYFQNRQVSKAENTAVSVNYLALYSELNLQWAKHDITFGGRYEYNDFFKQHKIAPRFRWQWQLVEDEAKINIGINRYYQANLTHYKLNQAITPAFNEYRRSYRSQLQNWLSSKTSQSHRYEYSNTKTPYSDEFSIDFQQQLFGGTLQLKWLNRKSKQIIAREQGFNDLDEPVLFGVNKGSSEHQRYTLAWMANYENFHVQFNLSKSSNKVDSDTFDGNFSYGEGTNYTGTDNFSDQELVILRTLVPVTLAGTTQTELVRKDYVITQHDLGYQQQDFNRPIIANLSLAGEFGNWELSSHFRYSGSQDAIYATGQTDTVSLEVNVCDGCTLTKKDFPVYRKYQRKKYWQADASIKYHIPVLDIGNLTLSADFKNIFNRRTYQIGPLATGTELGRRFWLGIRYTN